jgi:type II secretory pathway pseudopilin PulG
MNITYNITRDVSNMHRGVTLLEILLYIGLFSIVCLGTIPAYISVTNILESAQVQIQEREIQYLFYEIFRYKFDTLGERYNISDSQILLNRVLTFYPRFVLDYIKAEPVAEIPGSISNTESKIIKIEYEFTNHKYHKQTLFIYLI